MKITITLPLTMFLSMAAAPRRNVEFGRSNARRASAVKPRSRPSSNERSLLQIFFSDANALKEDELFRNLKHTDGSLSYSYSYSYTYNAPPEEAFYPVGTHEEMGVEIDPTASVTGAVSEANPSSSSTVGGTTGKKTSTNTGSQSTVTIPELTSGPTGPTTPSKSSTGPSSESTTIPRTTTSGLLSAEPLATESTVNTGVPSAGGTSASLLVIIICSVVAAVLLLSASIGYYNYSVQQKLNAASTQ